MSPSLLIKNGLVTDCGGQARADVLIENGIIARVGQIDRIDRDDCETLDASGLAVMPAFVDLHAHLRDPGLTHKEDAASGCRAAAAGGYTTLVAMANTGPVCSDLETARDVMRRAAEQGICDVSQCVSLTKDFDGRTTSHLDAIFSGDTGGQIRFVSDDGHGIKSGAVFREGLEKCAAAGRVLLIHAEEEDEETARDARIAEELGLRAHFCHVSTRVSAEIITAAKRRGAKLTFEVTPHHIALNDSTEYRVNPPLRPEGDRRFLIDCLKNGLADAISTDHAPHTPEDKAAGAPGLVGLETAFAVCYSVLCAENGLPLPALSNLMSRSPAKIMGINKGEIKPGFIGDIIVADVNARYTIDSSRFYSKGRNTPFDGMEYYGKVLYTVKNGRIIYGPEGFK